VQSAVSVFLAAEKALKELPLTRSWNKTVGTREHHVVHIEISKQELKIGRVECAQAFLGSNKIISFVDFDHEVEPLRALPAVLVHCGIGGQIHSYNQRQFAFAVRLREAMSSMPPYLCQCWHMITGIPRIAARPVKLIVSLDYGARSGCRACDIGLSA
jgi:hypothetical protein